ncbi:MAG: T9SS type A sorting domain-containing protein [Bacteroidota bacterium]
MRLAVYDVLGRDVATLVNEQKSAGIFTAEFTATVLTSGVYTSRLTAGYFSATKSMVKVR